MQSLKLLERSKQVIKHPLLAGSMVMVIGSNLFNLAQFVYHFITGRMLGKALYGDFASIVSILGIVGIIQISLGLTIIKFVASKKREGEISNFIKWVNFWSIWAGVVVAVLMFIASPWLVNFFNFRERSVTYLLALMLLFFITLNVQRSVLQGLLRFDKYVLSLFAEGIVKIALSVLFMLLGLAVFGAVMGFFVGILASLLVSRASLSYYLKGPRGKKPDLLPLFRYSIPTFVQGLALTSMYSMDLLLVKHFFAPDIAGIYASLAVLGRVALFATTPVTHTMFPLVAQRFAHGKAYHNIFYLSVLMVGLASFLVTLFYLFLPGIPVGVLYGNEYLEGASILWWFGLFMSLLSLAMLFTQFYLSIGKTRIVWLFAIAALLQVVLIWFIHPSILTVIQISILCAALLVLALLIYFPYHNRHGKAS